eukprot:3722098-Alexandrium_andersonii.AAC.1
MSRLYTRSGPWNALKRPPFGALMRGLVTALAWRARGSKDLCSRVSSHFHSLAGVGGGPRRCQQPSITPRG